MIDADYAAWLSSPSAIRMVLLEVVVNVGGTEVTRYLSTTGYNTTAAETPSNQHYKPIITTGIQFTEQLSLTGQASLSAGDIEIVNFDGLYDSWLNDVWVNRQVQAFVGDPRWPRADFRMIFNGVVADIAPKDRNTLSLKLRDKLQRLNTPLSEVTLGGSTNNKDNLLPLSFGEVHNITPLLSNPATLQYAVHTGAVEAIFEVRDNGIPVSVTATLATGKFVLLASPAGAITVSAQGDKPVTYEKTCSKLVQNIVKNFGSSTSKFVDADLDAANLAAFETAHPQPMGLFAEGRTNVLTACQDLAGSIGAQIVMSRLGLLQLFQITLPGVGTPVVIQPKHMLEKSLAPVNRTDVIAAVTLGFNKNWTPQPGLLTAIPVRDQDLFSTEWLVSTAADATTKASYKLDAAPVQQDTMLLRRTDADVEAARQLALWKVPRTIYRFEGLPEMLLLTLGQAVTVYNSRFGMSAGVSGIVISLSPNWLNGHVMVEFLV